MSRCPRCHSWLKFIYEDGPNWDDEITDGTASYVIHKFYECPNCTNQMKAETWRPRFYQGPLGKPEAAVVPDSKEVNL